MHTYLPGGLADINMLHNSLIFEVLHTPLGFRIACNGGFAEHLSCLPAESIYPEFVTGSETATFWFIVFITGREYQN